MKKVLILCVALTLYATSAFAVGVDLTAVGCPGNAITTPTVEAFDCALGDVVTLQCTFSPAEAIADLVSADCIVDLAVNGDLATNASFWDVFVNQTAVGVTHTKPSNAAGCSGYIATWSVTGSAEGIAFGRRSASADRMGIVVVRPATSPLSVAQNAKLFGFQLSFDTSTSAEAGGVGGVGCSTVAATVVVQQVQPGSLSGQQTTLLTSPSLVLQGVPMGANGSANAPSIGSVPVQRHTWGRLKSLYR